MVVKLDQQNIIDKILCLYKQNNSIIDSIVEVCTIHDVEIESIANYIKTSKELKEFVKNEATALKLLKK